MDEENFRDNTHTHTHRGAYQKASDDIIHSISLAILVILVVDHTFTRRAETVG